MVLSVGVVTVLTISAAQRDPEQIARKAAAQEEQGNYRIASDLYLRAFRVGKEVRYLLESARCAHEIGEIGECIQKLMMANAQEPNNTAVLRALLELYWEVRTSGGVWENIRDYAERLLALEPNNLFALAALARALDALKQQDPTYAERSQEILDKAMKIDPVDPRVAEVRVRKLIREARMQIASRRRAGRSAEADRIMQETRRQAIAILTEALQKHPEDTSPIDTLVPLMVQSDQLEACERLLQDINKRHPQDADVRYALAYLRYHWARRAREQQQIDLAAAQAKEGLVAADATTTTEPAYYRAYVLRALLMRLGWELDGTWETQSVERQRAILDYFAQAVNDTVGLKSVKAQLNRSDRIQMMAEAFDEAIEFYGLHTDDETRQVLLRYAEQFLESARLEFPKSVMVALMEGQYLLVKGDRKGAIQAFSRAEERAQGAGERLRIAQQQLASLYALEGQYGLALRYNERLADWYRTNNQEVPTEVYLQRADLLTRLNRAEEALDILDVLKAAYPNDARVARQRAIVLSKLGRLQESEKELERVGGQNPNVLLMKAALAIARDRTEDAEKILRDLVEDDPANLTAILMLVRLYVRQDRRDSAEAFLVEQMHRTEDESTRRMLEAYRIAATAATEEERNRRLLHLIENIEDPQERAFQLFTYWYGRKEYRKAANYMDELEKYRGRTAQICQAQLELALRFEDFDRAEQYVARLAEMDADRAGGATFRGRLAVLRGDLEAGLREFRAAERALPTDVTVKLLLARTLLMQDPPATAEAIDVLRQAVEFDPLNFDANRLLYIVLANAGRMKEAIPYLIKAAQIRPNDPFIAERKRLLEEEQDPQVGIAQREKEREQNPQDVGNLTRLAELYMRVGNYANAEEVLGQAVQISPSDPTVARLVERHYAQVGKREEGEQLLRACLDASDGPNRVATLLLFAKFYEDLDDYDAALEAFRKAQETADRLMGEDPQRGRAAQILVLRDLGNFYLRRGRVDDMLDTHRRVLSLLDPSDTANIQIARLKIITALLDNERLEEAEREIRAYRADFPDDDRGVMARAEWLRRRGDFERARELLDRVLQDNPSHVWSLYRRAQVNLALHRYREAREDLLHVKELAPAELGIAPRLDLVRLYVFQQQYELAETELRELLSQEPNNRQVALLLVRLLQTTDQPERAQEFINQMWARNQDDPFWPYQLGLVLIDRGQYGAAVAPLHEAAKLTKLRNARLVVAWLRALVEAGRHEEAIQAIQGLDASVRIPYVLTLLAEAQHKLNRREQARQNLLRAVRLAAQRSLDEVSAVTEQMRNILGVEQVQQLLRSELQREELEQSTRQRLSCALARELLTEGKRADFEEAAQIANELLAEAPAGSPLRVQVLLTLARAYEVLEQFAQAVECYEEILRILPNSVPALNNLAYMLADKLDRAAEAIPYAERAKQLAPENADVLDTVAWTYFLSENVTQAEAILHEALALEPKNLAVLYHLGQICEKTGRPFDARRYYERLLEVAISSGQQDSEYREHAEAALQRLQ